jgi:hypothetical protein
MTSSGERICFQVLILFRFTSQTILLGLFRRTLKIELSMTSGLENGFYMYYEIPKNSN